MAEAFLNKYGKGCFIGASAGLEPGKMNPNVVDVMKEVGIDLSHKGTQGVMEVLQRGDHYDAVITVCDNASAEKCPVFPGNSRKIAWSFEDPSSVKGTQEKILERTRKIRDEIEQSVKDLIKDSDATDYWL